MASLWQEAFDEVSQCTYYYHTETGETSWTLPAENGYGDDEADDAEDLSYMVFAVVRLQARLRGQRGRRRATRLLRAQYETARDPVTQQTLYTNRQAGTSSWSPPALARRLGVDLEKRGNGNGNGGGDDDDDDDEDMDFDIDAFQREHADDDEGDGDGDGEDDTNQGNREEDDDEDDEDADDTSNKRKKKKRKSPRSLAQQRVDAAEDDDTGGPLALDLSTLQAWKLSSRIWNLATLLRLSLAHNQLTRIPSGIQDLVNLQHLDLSHNQLTRIPSCLQTTSTLTFLDASHNRIASFSPKLWKLRALTQLHLSHNALLEVPFIEGDLKLLRDTREWQVGVGLLTRLELLDLSHNKLSASPRSIEKCGALRVLDLSYNRLGALGDDICELEALTELRVGHNALTMLPETIGSLSRLMMLRVDTNKLTALPESIGNLQQLVELDLRDNCIHHLPEEVGALGKLQTLTLDGNSSLASLAMCLRFLPSVVQFSATKCGLVAFDAIDFLCRAPVLRLSLCDNALLEFPVNMQRSAMKTSLQELELARNSLLAFPMEIVTAPCVSLVRLDLSYNRLRVIPSEICSLRSLRVLVLSHNAIGPSLPESIAWLPQLLELKCAYNKLTRLPLAIGILKKLQHIDASWNALVALPTSIVDLSDSLKSLVVNDNQLKSPPPVVAVLVSSCFVDLSNNPFCRATVNAVGGETELTASQPMGQQPQVLYARAVKGFYEEQYEEAEAFVTKAIHVLERDDGGDAMMVVQDKWRLREQLLPQQLLLRGLVRFKMLKQAQEIIEETSRCIDAYERDLHGACLLQQRAAQRQVKAREETKTTSITTAVSPLKRQNSTNQHTETETPVEDDRPETTESEAVAGGAKSSVAVGVPLPRSNQTDDDSSNTQHHNQRHDDTLRRRSEARQRAAAATSGALEDLERAIPLLPRAELTTALYVQGLLYMETLQFPLAIESFSRALEHVRSSTSSSQTPVSLQPPPLTSVAILMARAQAYRLLGQLPAALADLRLIIDGRPVDTPERVTTGEELLAREWDVLQSQYFVDHESLHRAFDVASASGLARRPEVHDAHAILTPQQKQELTNKTPSQRFDAAVQSLRDAMDHAARSKRQTIQATYDQKALVLKRARDFKREIRENLAMEMEEATQRHVESERMRLAELKREEMDREFNERMVMKYEDEYMKWLLGEELRLEAERLRREEDARRRADAKVQYEMRLARRGGRRQQLASRGANGPPRKASVTPTATRSSSPPPKSTSNGNSRGT